MSLAPELSAEIEARIAAIIKEPPSRQTESAQVVAQLHFLPLFLDWGGCWGIRPDGEIIALLWDAPEDWHVEREAWKRNFAIYQGSKKYPELAPLVPSRPLNARTCPGCKGTGRCDFRRGYEHLSETIVCGCGGLGWFPPSEKDV